MKISIIVLTYNQEKTIARTIDSILQQNTKIPFEIIIGDDASTDGTRAICEEYQNRFPDIVKINSFHSNYGVVKNYEEALQRCTGSYVMECAGDDWWHNVNKIEIQVSFMESNPNCVACYGGFRELIVAKNSYIERHPIEIKGKQFDSILKGNPICAPTVCIRKSTLDKLNFSSITDNGFLVEDYPLWLGLSLFGDICAIDKSLATYSVYKGSVHNNNDYSKRCKYIDNFHNMRIYYAKLSGRYNELKSEIDDIYFIQKGETAIQYGNRDDAIAAYKSIRNKDLRIRIKSFICVVPVLFRVMTRRYNKYL